MAIFRLCKNTEIAAPLAEVWDFFARPENLDRLTPPELSFHIITPNLAAMYSGQLIEYKIKLLPFVRVKWLTEIKHVKEGEYFVDEQRFGPYKFWYHEHRFVQLADGRVHMQDQVSYDVGLGWIGVMINAMMIRRRLAYIFDYRQRLVEEIFKEKTEQEIEPAKDGARGQ
jgi:ligand-binding SRPBCC domain-containing protein